MWYGLTITTKYILNLIISGRTQPFQITFISDGIELAEDAAKEAPTKGFQVRYFQTNTC